MKLHKVDARICQRPALRRAHQRIRCVAAPTCAPAQAQVATDMSAQQGPTMLQYQFVAGAHKAGAHSPVDEFITKLHMAWRIFFPTRPKTVTPKEDCKTRLRMILVADRCGISHSSMTEMKKTIVRALEHYVDIESEDRVEVAITSEPDVGTVYSVQVPIRRVKPEVRKMEGDEEVEGIQVEWDTHEYDKDPAARFPYGC